MKTRLVLLPAIVLVASLAWAVASQTSGTAAYATGLQRHSGEIMSVDARAHEVLIKEADGKQMSLAVDKDTRITREGQAASFADLKAGEEVSAECDESSGTHLAKTITIQAGR